jgi:hypothetical protein
VFLQAVTYGVTGSEYKPLHFATLNHTAVLVTTAPSIGRRLVFLVSVVGQTSPPSEVSVSFAPPTVLLLTPSRGDTSASSPMACTIVGKNFGLLDPTAVVVVRSW